VFEVGDLVDSRHQGGQIYYAARVVAIGGGNNGVSYDLEYLDGDKEQGVSPDFVEGLYGTIGDAGNRVHVLQVADDGGSLL
jgi:hypothetical protein